MTDRQIGLNSNQLGAQRTNKCNMYYVSATERCESWARWRPWCTARRQESEYSANSFQNKVHWLALTHYRLSSRTLKLYKACRSGENKFDLKFILDLSIQVHLCLMTVDQTLLVLRTPLFSPPDLITLWLMITYQMSNQFLERVDLLVKLTFVVLFQFMYSFTSISLRLKPSRKSFYVERCWLFFFLCEFIWYFVSWKQYWTPFCTQA